MKQSFRAVILLMALTGVYVLAQATSNGSSTSDQNSQSATGAQSNAQAPTQGDQQLLSQIQQQLSSDPAFKNVQASMTSKDVVILTGTVANKTDRKRAKDTVASIPGVKKVRDRISINPSAGSSASNAPATAGGTAGMAAGSNPSSSGQNTAGSIAGNTQAEAGTAEGSSSTVGNPGATSATEQSTPSASGSSSASSTAQQIQQTINQEISNSNVTVSQTRNDIVLSGTVSAESDRDRAESIAKRMAQGTTVVNQINVGTSSPMSSSSAAPSSGTANAPSSSAETSTQGGTAGSANATPPSTSASGQASSSSNIGSSTANTGSAAPSGQASESVPPSSGAEQSGAAASSSDLQAQIQKALQDQNLSGITVNVTDSTIELSGSAATGKERREAMQIAQSYAGNRKVIDHITVSGRGQGANQGKSENPSGNPPMSEQPPMGNPSNTTPHY
jgi:osmotically-inducible protein OsmY